MGLLKRYPHIALVSPSLKARAKACAKVGPAVWKYKIGVEVVNGVVVDVVGLVVVFGVKVEGMEEVQTNDAHTYLLTRGHKWRRRKKHARPEKLKQRDRKHKTKPKKRKAERKMKDENSRKRKSI